MRVVLLLLVLLGATAMGSYAAMNDLVPPQIDGWKSDGKDGLYDRKTLYSYIDGGAEVYLAYDFRQAFARRFVKPGKPGITLDLFDMGCSEDAYGVFTFEREDPSAGIGSDSEYAAGFLRFRKGRYFVSILADQETPATREAVLALGKAIAASIKDDGPRPEILSLLPPKNLVGTSVRFFHQVSGLNYHFFVSDKNILNLSRDTDVLLAQYKDGDIKPRMLIVRYPDSKAAQAALESFSKAMTPAARNGAAQAGDGTWTMAGKRDCILAIVFGSESEKSARTMVDGVLAKVEVSK